MLPARAPIPAERECHRLCRRPGDSRVRIDAGAFPRRYSALLCRISPYRKANVEQASVEPEARAAVARAMNRRARHIWGRVGVVGVIAVSIGVLHPAAVTAQTPGGPVARAVSVQGAVEARRAGQAPWQTVKLNDTFVPGDAIRVGDRGRADLAMLDQSVLRLNANTEMVVEAVKDQRTGVVNLLRGAAHFFSRGPRSLEVQTPFTVAGVRGTESLDGAEANRP